MTYDRSADKATDSNPPCPPKLAASATPDATVRIGGSMAIPAVLRSLGADPVTVLAEVGLDLSLFDNPENQISYLARGHLMAHCADRTACPHFGLLVGQQTDLRLLGLVGLLVKYSPDAGTALRSLTRYLHTHVRGAVTALTTRGEWSSLSYNITEGGVEGRSQINDGALASMFNILRSLCGPDWRPAEVQFAHRQPGDPAPYRRFFQSPLRFDAAQNAVVFAAQWLDRPLTEADPDLRRVLQREIDALQREHAEDFPGQVRSLLRTALLTDHAQSDRIAALFSMHPRTMSRRLAGSGTTFQALLDEGRFEISKQLLMDSSLDISEIAQALDYADPSAYTRAFRRWSGTTPARWRGRQGAIEFTIE